MRPIRVLAVLRLSHEAQTHLGGAVTAARPRTPGVPWVAPQAWFVRLAHFGPLDVHKLARVTESMTELASYCEPMALHLQGVVAHPQSGPADTVATELAGDAVADVTTLANAIPGFVEQHELFLDRRAFRPVVVVARGPRGPFDPTPATAALRGYRGPEWTTHEVQLLQHTYRADVGDSYTEVEALRFTG